MRQSLSRVWLFETPGTVAHQAPLSWDSPGKNTGVGCHFLLQYVTCVMWVQIRKQRTQSYSSMYQLYDRGQVLHLFQLWMRILSISQGYWAVKCHKVLNWMSAIRKHLLLLVPFLLEHVSSSHFRIYLMKCLKHVSTWERINHLFKPSRTGILHALMQTLHSTICLQHQLYSPIAGTADKNIFQFL